MAKKLAWPPTRTQAAPISHKTWNISQLKTSGKKLVYMGLARKKRGTETTNNPIPLDLRGNKKIPVYNWEVVASIEAMTRLFPLRRPMANIPPTTKILCY